MAVLQRALQLPRPDDPALKRQLASVFVNLSDAVRDLTIDISVTKFEPADVTGLRNLLQAIVRSVLAVETNTALPGMYKNVNNLDYVAAAEENGTGSQQTPTSGVTLLLSKSLVRPLRAMIISMKSVVKSSDAVLLDISGYRKYLSPRASTDEDLAQVLHGLQDSMAAFDLADSALVNNHQLPASYADDPEIVQILLFIHPVRQIASNVEALGKKVLEMQQTNRSLRFRWWSYPWKKALNRTNPQVRHDRGGLTAGFYFRSKRQLDRTMHDLQSRVYVPLPDHQLIGEQSAFGADANGGALNAGEKTYLKDRSSGISETAKFRYKLWEVIHTLQGFEMRFAFKVVVVTTSLSIPAWLPQSEPWWNSNESWWAVVMVWLMMHPRVRIYPPPSTIAD